MPDLNKKVRHAALHTLGCEPRKPDGGECFPVDVAGVTVDVLRNDRSLRVRRSAAAAMTRALGYDQHCRASEGE